MKVLSLFDGMSCGQIALRDMGIIPEVYYASEVDKFAIAQTQLNFPNTIQLGDVTKVDATKLGHIDLLIGGSPCQSFSFAGKRNGMSTVDNEEVYTLQRYLELKREGFQFEGQSYLFWEYMRILNEVRKTNPDVLFLLENVEMGKKWERVLSEAIGITGVHINSALVSAQTRKRIYWTNIRTRKQGLFGETVPDIPQPKDRGILLYDILQENVDEKYYVSDAVLERMMRKNYSMPSINPDKTGTLSTRNNSGQMALDSGTTFVYAPVVNDRGRLRQIDKSNCIVSNYWKGMDNHGMRTMVFEKVVCVAMRGRNPENPSDRTSGRNTEQRLEAKTDGKTNCLTSVDKDNLVYCCLASKRNEYGKAIRKDYEKGDISAKRNEISDLQPRQDGKTNTLTTVQKDNLILQKEERIAGMAVTGRGIRLFQNDKYHSSASEYGTIVYEDQKTNALTTANRSYFIENNPIPGTLRTFKQDYGFRPMKSGKAGAVPARAMQDGSGQNVCLTRNRIRRLTPTECARLQTIPEWYRWECSETQQYKMLGNGWTVEVIKHIFSFLPENFKSEIR